MNTPSVVPLGAGRDLPLRQALRELDPFLAQPGVTDLAINAPGELWLEDDCGWHRHEAVFLSAERIARLVQMIATYSGQVCNETRPLLSGALPGGERVQVVMPPAVAPGRISVTIRKPAEKLKTIEQYDAEGLFEEVIEPGSELTALERELLRARAERRYWDFLSLAVAERLNVVISGATGAGKTTFSKTLTEFIPSHERIVTIEDVREMFLPAHENAVHLLYSASGAATAAVEAKELLQAALRMKPSRILLAEVRSRVAYDYIVNVSSGHPGSITTVHAGSCAEAFEMLMMRMKESAEGQGLAREDILALLRAKVDVIVQMAVQERLDPHSGQRRRVRRVTELLYKPRSQRGDARL